MQRILIIFSFLFCFIGVNAQKAIPQSNPPSLVVDNANILTPDQKAQLERKLVAVDDSSSNQIAVLIIPSLNDQSIEDVANSTFRSWGIGDKKKKNGVLLLVSINDKKVRIEVGSGLEGAIPDVTTKDIIDNEIVPNFKQGNYFEGIEGATNDLIRAAVGEYKVQKDKESTGSNSNGFLIFFFMIAIVIIIVRNSRGGGGSGGGGGLWLAAPLLFGGGGFGGNDDNSSSFGGGDSGGFGGFGGGDSGGGGASGGW